MFGQRMFACSDLGFDRRLLGLMCLHVWPVRAGRGVKVYEVRSEIR